MDDRHGTRYMAPDMSYTRLGSTGLEVSRVALGCAGLGSDQPWKVHDREAARRIVDRAIEEGINFIDTANIYASGESEDIVGDAITGHDRSELVIASKVHGEMWSGPNGQGLSRKHVIDQAEASLDRLGTDYLDIYYLHRWDPNTPISETLSALDYLVNEGKVRYIGASTMAAWQLVKALGVSDVKGYERFSVIQPEYSLVRRHEEENMLLAAEDQGLGVVTWSPLGAGFLTGQFDSQNPEMLSGEGHSWRDLTMYDRDDCWTVLEEVHSIANRRDYTPVQVSLAWVLAKDVVDAPIIGPTSISELREYLGALDITLSETEIDALELPIDPVWSRERM